MDGIKLGAVASGTSAVTSFFVATLPIVQWCAAVVAIASGLVAIVWGIKKIRGASGE
jgi:hypothetical protein